MAGLVVALVAGFTLGRAGGSGDSPQPATGAHQHGTGGHDHGAGGPDHGTGAAAVEGDAGVGGVSMSAAGYHLKLTGTSFPAGGVREFRFQVRDRDGAPVTRFATVHDKQMHVVVVRRDLSGYQHLHPTMATDGTWSVPLALPVAGSWRAFADFSALDAAGRQVPVTLGADLSVAGNWAPRALPEPAPEATVDGQRVSYEGTPRAGVSELFTFRVSAGGDPSRLEPYLGTAGHLVMLREGDLGYVHVHPADGTVPSGTVRFWLAVPGPGRYRLYLDFKVAGVVRTAEFTLTVP